MQTGTIKQSRVSLGEITLHVAEAGPADGPLTILLHGFPEFWWGWRHQIGPLSDAGLRVVAPDQRGYNLSSKPLGVASYHLDKLAGDVIALADSFGRNSFRLVGHDWGALVGWWVAAHHPDHVERLAILNGPHPSVFGEYVRHHPSQALRSYYVGLFQLPWLPEAMLRGGHFAALRRALTRSSRPGTFKETDLDRYAEAWSQAGALTAMLNWYRALRLPRTERALRIKPPTLILWGRRDQALQEGLAAESLKLCDAGQIRWFDDATHWLHLEKPGEVNAALLSFLNRPA